MHEFSLIQNLFEIVKEKIQRQAKILKIEIEVGKISGAEPVLLKEAFEALKKGTEFEEAKLDIHMQEIEIECENCGKVFQPDTFPFQCPECEEFGGKIIKGDSLMIKRIEFIVP